MSPLIRNRYVFVEGSNVIEPGSSPYPSSNGVSESSVSLDESYLTMNVRFSTVKPFVSA